MGDYVLFHMWGRTREHLIASHEFYVAEARQRLLSPFTDQSMRAEAEQVAGTWLARMSARFDPDRDDPGAYYEQANDESVGFYLRLEELRDTTRLSIVAGMYHEWEKQLRDWLTRELMRVGAGKAFLAAIWKQPIGDLFEFFESWGWRIKATSYYKDLEICHLIVNVYKHGSGSSFDKLKGLSPAHAGYNPNHPYFSLDHTNLSVTDSDLERFSRAVVAFWRDLPENTFQSQISSEPKWVTAALKKDQGA
ncbi:hypothetical protein [Caulobacter endophyticus]|uniref:hypothetical protein n=1 Tax=Caulobacter endophyticus TaxID=2172652 RepID=UPI002410417D|nr:hypothetical protein [Caulobacter endophyticus]MDG2531281.1 hypothetical protein [Caulobacter endophyticus]